jgi:hypothetical protein
VLPVLLVLLVLMLLRLLLLGCGGGGVEYRHLDVRQRRVWHLHETVRLVIGRRPHSPSRRRRQR